MTLPIFFDILYKTLNKKYNFVENFIFIGNK
jgi:hypothetical protein